MASYPAWFRHILRPTVAPSPLGVGRGVVTDLDHEPQPPAAAVAALLRVVLVHLPKAFPDDDDPPRNVRSKPALLTSGRQAALLLKDPQATLYAPSDAHAFSLSLPIRCRRSTRSRLRASLPSTASVLSTSTRLPSLAVLS